jgi:hypothetical protein
MSWTAAAFDGKIYFLAIDGFNFDAQGNVVSAKPPFVQTYDIETDSWSRLGQAPTYGTTAVSLPTSGVYAPKRIYFLEGTETHVYDPANDSWTTGTPMPSGIPFGFGVAVVNDVFYVVGGRFGEHDLFVFMDPSAVNELYAPIGYGIISPVVSIILPENKTYNSSSVPLTFTVDKPVSWMQYSLDGSDNVAIEGNTTLNGLLNGLHNLTVYAKYVEGSVGASEPVHFSVDVPFPTVPVAVASGVSIAVIAAGVVVYLKKRRRQH